MGITRREFGSLALGAAAGAAMSEANAAQALTGITDCHVHIIGPQDKYPLVPNRPYTPPTASVAQLKAMHARLGVTRTVLVQPSFYGTDNSCMMDALAELGGSARGIAVCWPATPIRLRRIRPSRISRDATNRTVLLAIAKQIPCAGMIIAVLMPITSPDEVTSGPPELPGLSDASV